MFIWPLPARRRAAVLAAKCTPLCLLLMLSSALGLAGRHHRYADVPRIQYAANIRATYNFRFGKDQPFQPSSAQIEGDDFIQPGAFPSAAYCGHCHAGAYHQWSESLHRNSFREPFYLKNVTLLNDTKGIEYSRHCEGCHSPISLLSGALTQHSHVDRKVSDDEGVTCSVCHSIAKLQRMKGNGAYVMGVPAVIVNERGAPIPGEVPFKEILAHPDRHSKAVMKDFYRSPEFCGACHKSTIPTNLTDYKWLRGFGTYDEWQASAYSNRSPAPFYQKAYTTCQDCHMTREPVDSGEYGAKNGSIASHRWPGGNTAVPFYYGFDEQLRKTIDFLKNQTLNVDIFALKRIGSEKLGAGSPAVSISAGNEASAPGSSFDSLIAPLASSAADLHPREKVQAFVVIQNKGLGHSLIPEQRDFYEAWVEFTVSNSAGREIFHSGYLKLDGSLDQSAHSFTSRLIGRDGNLLYQHQIWDRRAIAFDNTILPGRSTLVRYQFTIPDASELKGPVTLTARVNYRHFNQKYLDYVLGSAHAVYPVIEMASVSRTLVDSHITIGNLASNLDPPAWLRWNNFGIALLDQSQFADAINAFEHVLKLRPDYADAFINIAAANLGWEHYSQSRTAIDAALARVPSSSSAASSATAGAFTRARALYFRALINRNLGDLDQSAADLEAVTEVFPQAREACRELAISYYLTHKDDLARSMFEVLQSSDPDDLLAHYYLSILYRRVGMTQKSVEQITLYEQKRDDPQAQTRALSFLHSHPEVDVENVPLHFHSLIQNGKSAESVKQ